MKMIQPPSWILHLFRWYSHPRLRDHIEGDLMEVYRENQINDGKRTADFKLILDVLLLCRPGIIRPLGGNQRINTYGMIQNNIKFSFRQLVKNKSFTFIMKSPPATVLIKKALKLDKGSATPHTAKVGKLTRAQLEEIVKIKVKDLTGADMDAAVRTIAGTARSMGVTTEGV